MVWIGLPYESPRELHGSTALGCAAIIEDLSFKECPVLGLIPFKNPEKSAEEIFLKSWSAIKSQGVLVGLIGGDHRVSYSCIKSLKTLYEKKSFVHLQLDAHHDLYESNPEVDRLSPANFNLALFRGNLIKHFILIGCRNNRYYIERAKKEGFSVFETLDGIKKDIFGQDFHWHLSIDIDVLDPAVCAGVTNPLIHGWSFHRMKNTLRNIFLIRRPDSVSIVEATSEDDQTINIAADLCIFIKELYSD